MDEKLKSRIVEAADEIANLKAYQPNYDWSFEQLKAQIVNVLDKHFPEEGR